MCYVFILVFITKTVGPMGTETPRQQAVTERRIHTTVFHACHSRVTRRPAYACETVGDMA